MSDLNDKGTAEAGKIGAWIAANPKKFWGFVILGIIVAVLLVL